MYGTVPSLILVSIAHLAERKTLGRQSRALADPLRTYLTRS
jgi:hypothetical protein